MALRIYGTVLQRIKIYKGDIQMAQLPFDNFTKAPFSQVVCWVPAYNKYQVLIFVCERIAA